MYIFTYYMIESCVLYNGSIRSSKISLKATRRETPRDISELYIHNGAFYRYIYTENKFTILRV